jgi:hypothetical protein
VIRLISRKETDGEDHALLGVHEDEEKKAILRGDFRVICSKEI